MASQKISQFTPVTTLASGDFFPIVLVAGSTNNRADVGVLDARYTSTASGTATLELGVNALASGVDGQTKAAVALASGVDGQTKAAVALASGVDGQTKAAVALSSGNSALAFSATRYAISGGLISGQITTNVVALGLNGSGINCALGNYFTATLSGASSVVFTNVPSGTACSVTYEVQNDTGTITWPSGVTWSADTPPTLTTGKTHVFLFLTDDGGSRWRSAYLVDYVN
jgi:hypothetical protein